VVWGRNINYPEIVRVVVHELRREIELRPSEPQYIGTEPQMGYKFILSDSHKQAKA
jgi:DNA-binding response OmpR family regulator